MRLQLRAWMCLGLTAAACAESAPPRAPDGAPGRHPDASPGVSGESGNAGDGGDAGDGDNADSSVPGTCVHHEPTFAAFAQDFFSTRCAPCHLPSSVGDARLGAPSEVSFGSEADIAYWQLRIRARALEERTMPPGAPLSECDGSELEGYLDTLGGAGACEPACADKDCGADGCGGSCGQCSGSQACAASGQCVDASCESMCEGVACGDDGCGGSCGECGPGFGCGADGTCSCAPQCEGKACGADGCGGSCGSCSGDDVCTADGQCLCIPDCSGRVCGDDGCGGTCGTCRGDDRCAADGGSCEGCVPDCSGKACGDDGCGGFCADTCTGPMQFCDNATNACKTGVCRDSCGTRECGYVGCKVCGTAQGACAGDDICDANGMCSCAPSCMGKACGDDGCGGYCGSCANGLTCDSGQCGCTAQCSGRECGSDGCGGTCGPNAGACDSGLSCTGAGQCEAVCQPDCSGKTCGSDGCGGSCGGCGSAESCDGGSCVASEVTFADVFAIFEQKTCARIGCHVGATAPEDLDLSTSSKAQAGLIDVPSDQCASRMRVLSGDSTESYLINKLTGSEMCFGSQMPKAETPLNNAQLDTVRAWIDSL